MRCSTWKPLGLSTSRWGPPCRPTAAPLTGPMAWAGDQAGRGAEVAVADLNGAACSANRVVAVLGHLCLGAAIPASQIYSEAGILMISTFATTRS